MRWPSNRAAGTDRIAYEFAPVPKSLGAKAFETSPRLAESIITGETLIAHLRGFSRLSHHYSEEQHRNSASINRARFVPIRRR
jgi:hypothetical protein